MRETPGILIRYADQGALEIVKYALLKADPNMDINVLEDMKCVFIPREHMKLVIQIITEEGSGSAISSI